MDEFSPHAWGWTVDRGALMEKLRVFPTRVGVDLVGDLVECRIARFPHTRGGGPYEPKNDDSVFRFSPHAWGWTSRSIQKLKQKVVFPTRVGVDLYDPAIFDARSGFPHTRGGGPKPQTSITQGRRFSPHAWGWTAQGEAGNRRRSVFPTRVGVDLPHCDWRISQ